MAESQSGRRRGKEDRGPRMSIPSKPDISRLSEDSVMVRWDVPITGGLAINFFKIQYRELERKGSPGPAWKTVDEDIAPHIHSYAVSGLRTGSAYKFRIIAVYSNNDNRQGPKSDKFVLLKDPPMKRPPSGPQIYRAEAISQSAILLGWTYQEQDSIPVDGFFIHYRDTSSAGEYYKATSLGSNTRSHIITHLLPDTSYDIKMQCFNVAGTSNFSNIVSNKTWLMPEPSTTPYTPTIASTTPRGNFPRILTPISTKFDQTFYLTIGISVVVLILVFIVIAILCCNRKKDNASTGSTSSQNIVTSRKNKMKNERHPKANSLHNSLHHINGGNNKFTDPSPFDNHYKVHHTNGISNGHHLAKSMNGLTVKSSNTNGFVFRDVDEHLNENNFDIRIPLRRQMNDGLGNEDEIDGSIRMSYETNKSRTLASSSFIANRSQSTRDIQMRKASASQHSLYHNNQVNLNRNTNNVNNNIEQPNNLEQSNNFAGISTIERRRKVYNEDIHPNFVNTNSVKISHRSTSFTRLNGTLERKKRSRIDLVSACGPESACEDEQSISRESEPMMHGTATWNGRMNGVMRNNNFAQPPRAPSSNSSVINHNHHTMNGGYQSNTINSHHPPSRANNGNGHFMMMQSSC